MVDQAQMTAEATEMNWRGTLVMLVTGTLGEHEGGILHGTKLNVSGVDMDQAMLLADSLRKGLTLTTAVYKVTCRFTAVLEF